MLVNEDVQNDVPHSCTKPMHQINVKNGTCHRFKGQNSRRTVSPKARVFFKVIPSPEEQFLDLLVLIQGDSIRLVVSAAIIAPPLAMQWRPEFLGVPKSLRTPKLALQNQETWQT